MARPLRLELAGALYHVTSRGNGREDIYLSDDDRESWLDILARVCERFNWVCHAYCQMTNHYHLVIETPDANLVIGMRHLNGVYTQYFNRFHRHVGHVFQGRYKAILVEKDIYLLELARYVVLNPLRAGMIAQLEDWPWSSYLATSDQADRPIWLQCDFILSLFSSQRPTAITDYIDFVYRGRGVPAIWGKLKGQIFLGSPAFIEKMQSLVKQQPSLTEIPRAQRRAIVSDIAEFERLHNRKDAIALAYLSGQYTMSSIAAHFGVHYTTVSRLVKAYESRNKRKGIQKM